MLDVLRDLFLRAIKCKTCSEANHLVDLWNEEVESINKRFNLYYTGKREVEAPTADVAPVVHAHWKLKAKLWWGTIYECSHCGRFVTLDKGTSRILLRTDYPHCHCGAKMDEEVKGDEV